MPILILINVRYLQIVVFSFEKGLGGQGQSSSDFHQLIKQSPPTHQSLSSPPSLTVMLFEKTLGAFERDGGVDQPKMKLIHFVIK